MQMRVYKQFYMIFVLMRACLWNVSSSFASNGHTDVAANKITSNGNENSKAILVAAHTALYVPDVDVTEREEFLGTQVSRLIALPVFRRDKVYNKKNLSGERARFLKLLLFPNHSFG